MDLIILALTFSVGILMGILIQSAVIKSMLANAKTKDSDEEDWWKRGELPPWDKE